MKATTTINFFVNIVKQVCTATISNDLPWTVNLSLEGLTVLLKFDTSSDVNICRYYKKLKRKLEIKPTKIRTISYTGDVIPITGKIYITINRNDTLYKLCFIITPRKVKPILGKDAYEKLNIK